MREPGETGRPHLFPQLKAIVEQWLNEYLHCDLDTWPAQALYPNIANLAGERIKAAIANAARAGHNNNDTAEPPIKAVIAPYTPQGSTRHVNFTTTRRSAGRFNRQILDTDPQRCHINRAVCESSWETTFCRIIEAHPQVIAYAKNYGLGLEVPYKLADAAKTYLPDFIVQINDGQGPDHPLNLIAEIKGYRNEDAQAKARTMQAYWIPGVNNLHTQGRWAFHEFTSAFDMAAEFDRVVRGQGLAGAEG